ncbi:hypothetical protein LY78DRAFT_128396 [Colletotrichum sublineola]|nr:hypothetical protein LY78DRAFT_128396 [Colletotrichum sublineola]
MDVQPCALCLIVSPNLAVSHLVSGEKDAIHGRSSDVFVKAVLILIAFLFLLVRRALRPAASASSNPSPARSAPSPVSTHIRGLWNGRYDLIETVVSPLSSASVVASPALEFWNARH